jgi:hypothetical protein
LITPVISGEECSSWSSLLFSLLHAPVPCLFVTSSQNFHCLAYTCSVSCQCACARISGKPYIEVI